MFTPAALGTPNTSSTVRVLLLGSGELGKEVAIAFQRLGVEVHAADRYPEAPAHQVAHYAYTLDMTDPQAVRELVTRIHPHFVVPEIEAIATDALVELEAAGHAVVPTARTTKLTMNREGIRRLAAEELGLPTSSYRFASSQAEFQTAVSEIGFPCVVKPVMSSSGKGQSVVRSAEEITAAWEYAMSGARVEQPRVIVEGFVEFDYEITLLTVRAIAAGTGEIDTYFCAPIGHRQVDGDYVESWQPMQMSELALKRAQEIASQITGALGGRGVFGVELFIKGDEVYFSEVSPRPHDTGLVTLGTQRLSEFELHARAILGLPVDVTLRQPGASAVVKASAEITSPRFTGVAAALAVPETDVRIFGKPNALPGRRMGVVYATGSSTDEARARANKAASVISVLA